MAGTPEVANRHREVRRERAGAGWEPAQTGAIPNEPLRQAYAEAPATEVEGLKLAGQSDIIGYVDADGASPPHAVVDLMKRISEAARP